MESSPGQPRVFRVPESIMVVLCRQIDVNALREIAGMLPASPDGHEPQVLIESIEEPLLTEQDDLF